MPLILTDGTAYVPPAKIPARKKPYLEHGRIFPSATIAELSDPEKLYGVPLYRRENGDRPSYLPPIAA
jgi:hypothetical protein